jgi:hypothetical protein
MIDMIRQESRIVAPVYILRPVASWVNSIPSHKNRNSASPLDDQHDEIVIYRWAFLAQIAYKDTSLFIDSILIPEEEE